MNKADFSLLYNKYHGQVYTYALSILKDDLLAEDVVQDVFVKLWEIADRIEGEELQRLIFSMTKRKIIDLWRKQISSRKYQEYFINNYCEADAHTTNQIDLHELQDQLGIVLNQLTETQSRIFKMSKLEGYSYAEISEEMGISIHTVKYHLVHSMRMIKFHLKSFIQKTMIFSLVLLSTFFL